MPLNKQAIQVRARHILDPVAGFLLRLGLSPNALTLLGLALSIGCGFLIGGGHLLIASLVLLLGGLCDMLDGGMARRGSLSSQRGAFLDSTLDRLAEIAMYLGLLVFFHERLAMQLVTGLALTGSLMTSYARARSEGLGIECKVGLLERPERLILLFLGLLLAPVRLGGITWLELILGILAVLSYVTTFQRIVHVLSKSSREGTGKRARRQAGAL